MLEHGHLRADLRAADDCGVRPLGVLNRPAEELDLLLHQEPRHRRQQPRDALRRSVRAVRGPKRVVRMHLAQAGERLRVLPVVRLLFRMKPQVLEQQYFTLAERMRRALHLGSYAAVRHLHPGLAYRRPILRGWRTSVIAAGASQTRFFLTRL